MKCLLSSVGVLGSTCPIDPHGTEHEEAYSKEAGMFLLSFLILKPMDSFTSSSIYPVETEMAGCFRMPLQVCLSWRQGLL